MNLFDITRFNARAQENRELKSTNEGLRKQVAGLTAAYGDLSADNDRLFSENDQQLTQLTVLRGRNKRLGEENAALKIQLRKYTHEQEPDSALGTLERIEGKTQPAVIHSA